MYQRRIAVFLAFLFLIGTSQSFSEEKVLEDVDDISQEDLDIIRDLDFLEALDFLGEDIELLEEYETINELKE